MGEARLLRAAAALAAGSLFSAGCGGGPGITPVQTAFNRGAFHYAKGDYQEAIAEYRAALAEDDDDHRSRFNLALALEALASRLAGNATGGGPVGGTASQAERMRAEAEEQYRLILERRPGDLRAEVNLAACEYERGLRAEALARLRSLIKKHPRAALPRVALASHLLRDGGGPRREEAIELLMAALEEDPAGLEANLLLGEARAARGEHDLAREAFRRALKRSPSDLATLLALGRLEVKAGEPAAATVWLRQALFVDPDQLQAHRLLADVLEAQGDLEGAVGHLWRARELDRSAGKEGASTYGRRLLSLYRRLAAQEEKSGTAPGFRPP